MMFLNLAGLIAPISIQLITIITLFGFEIGVISRNKVFGKDITISASIAKSELVEVLMQGLVLRVI